MMRYRLIALALVLLLPACDLNKDASVVFSVKGKYTDVRDDLENAIIDRGLVVNNVSHISKMLDRTGKDLGYNKRIYLHAESLEFCSATTSRKTMEADAENIVFCPYIVSVYETTKNPGTIYVAYRKVTITGTADSRKALTDLNKLIDGIAREAANK